ncbi:uncharacterized protein BKA78DRAFT_305075 [Phyllosticta capitalensis]|uniref:uncharacterized protein n=1 Tax=Phyllosticta capitalensis TaxID=121624 RepID=UPI003130336E
MTLLFACKRSTSPHCHLMLRDIYFHLLRCLCRRFILQHSASFRRPAYVHHCPCLLIRSDSSAPPLSMRLLS